MKSHVNSSTFPIRLNGRTLGFNNTDPPLFPFYLSVWMTCVWGRLFNENSQDTFLSWGMNSNFSRLHNEIKERLSSGKLFSTKKITVLEFRHRWFDELAIIEHNDLPLWWLSKYRYTLPIEWFRWIIIMQSVVLSSWMKIITRTSYFMTKFQRNFWNIYNGTWLRTNGQVDKYPIWFT